jgi:hypothetical protein
MSDFACISASPLIQSKINSISNLDCLSEKIDNKLDKDELEALIESQINSVFDLNSISQRLDTKLDKDELEALIESQINSVIDLNSISQRLDTKLDKNELEVLVKSQVESILTEANLLKQIDSKLHNTIDKEGLQTLVKSLVNSTFNQDSLLKVIDKMIDDKLKTVASPPFDVAEGVNIDNQEDVSFTENEEVELSIDNVEDISSTENDDQIIEETEETNYTEQISPEKEATMEVKLEKSIAEAIDDVEDTQQQIQIPLAFQQLPLGVVKVTALAKSLGINHVTLGRIAQNIEKGKSYNIDFFPQLWDYVEFESVRKKDTSEDTESEDTKGKVVRVWKKIK